MSELIPLTDISDVIRFALNQDLGPLGDVTSQAIIPAVQLASADFIIKAQSGIVSGLNIVQDVFNLVDSNIQFTPLFKNGDNVKKGDVIAKVSGPARSLLAGERVALEFLRRMSGIASKTAEFVKETAGTKTIILDTRKIFPGYGPLDKQAVHDGGGKNHRMNLSEMGMIKNNHIDVLGGDLARAIHLFREKYPNIPLEVEVRNENELVIALQNKPNRIMLDNMDNIQTANAVAFRNQYTKETGINIPLEASGNMSLNRIKSVAETGVEFISVGALTHSVEAFDISMHIIFNN